MQDDDQQVGWTDATLDEVKTLRWAAMQAFLYADRMERREVATTSAPFALRLLARRIEARIPTKDGAS